MFLPALLATHQLLVEATWALVYAFVISHVDYCNGIFGSMSAVHLHLFTVGRKWRSTSYCQEMEVWLHYRLCATNFTGCQSSRGIPIRYAFSSISACTSHCKPSSQTEVYSLLPTATSDICWKTLYTATSIFSVIDPRVWKQLSTVIWHPSLRYDIFVKDLKLLFNRVYYVCILIRDGLDS